MYVFLVVATTILIADTLWLGWIANPMYHSLHVALNPGISSLPFRWIPALLAYTIMTITLSLLVVPQVATKGDTVSKRVLSALYWGGLWGLAVYGTYNTTNLAIIQRVPTHIALIDTFWGVLLGSIASFVGSYVE